MQRHLLIHGKGKEAGRPVELVLDQLGADPMVHDVEEPDISTGIMDLGGDGCLILCLGMRSTVQVDNGDG